MRHVLLALLLLAGCSREFIELSTPNGPDLPGLTALSIEPDSIEVVSDGRAPGEVVTLKAIGIFGDETRDVSAEVRWEIDDPALATIDGTTLTTAASLGGETTVRAVTRDLDARATLRVRLEVVDVEEGLPANVVEQFAPTAGAVTSSLAFVYPANDTVVPSNLLGLQPQWRSTFDDQVYELTCESDGAVIRFYVTTPFVRFDDVASDWIVRANAGGDVTMTLRSVDRDGVLRRSVSRIVHVARSELRGHAIFWSSTAQGLSIGRIGGTPYSFDVSNDCVGCHAVSRDGRRVALLRESDHVEVYEVPSGARIYPRDGSNEEGFGWMAFSPDGTKLLTSDEGHLRHIDLDSGRRREIDLPGDQRIAQLDWSSEELAVATVLQSGRAQQKFRGSSLIRFEVEDDEVEHVETLLTASSPDDTLFAPSISPDGAWVAFTRASGDSKDNPDSTLWIVDAEGRRAPVELVRANVETGEGVRANLQNSLAVWAPGTEPGQWWLGFTSTRDYGAIASGLDQLWMTSIDVGRLAAGADPSSPAFWVPAQDPTESNHRAFWIEPAACVPRPEVCDGFDDDCNGTVDDDCCTIAPEVCGNGEDDDCDGVADEGCGCATVEICGNGVDDDCDDEDDTRDEDCR